LENVSLQNWVEKNKAEETKGKIDARQTCAIQIKNYKHFGFVVSQFDYNSAIFFLTFGVRSHLC
jgi:hypothetical protein